MELVTLSVRDLLDEVASDSAAPGGGPVAGLVVALSAGLVAKAARGSSDTWAEAPGAAAQAVALSARAERLARDDAEAHVRAVAALELAADAPIAGPNHAMADALARAADVPLAIAGAAVEVAELAAFVAGRGDPDRRPDAQAAAVLARAAAEAAAGLVEVNLTMLPGDMRIREARQRVEAATRAADRALGVVARR